MAPVPIAMQWLRGFWEYYRGYTRSAVHAAAAAALTIFGLLIFIDPIFAVLAIGSYIFPPIVLYVFGTDVGTDSKQPDLIAASAGSDTGSHSGSGGDSDSDNGDTDSDSDDGDTDSDTDGTDTDSDTDGTDTDTDTDG
ncbi:hypothetical protein NDI56_17290 [Haloarcula sp. S1CR25-12]|uniref:Uncharacterized protein n=1 Tax=Haloarcula saliterrae TaxID=2950534 RepID=A0ABU2FFZ3_9EURY|nr:hypothetical protein [Haloarcula sp. S1CR25-12]MDS0261157.1 hypothetical protein [Haloarcula sp. S1CR25-12]